MNNKKILVVFILVALVQLFVPAKIVFERETILRNGKIFNFQTAPVDPNDPFRGKYIELSFKEIEFKVENENDWHYSETIYISLTTDKDGYAKIKSVSKEKPTDTQDYVIAQVRSVSSNNFNEITIEYPFNKFFLKETKAYNAEQYFRDTIRDTSKVAYAQVKIKNGKAVIIDVLIDGTSVKKL